MIDTFKFARHMADAGRDPKLAEELDDALKSRRVRAQLKVLPWVNELITKRSREVCRAPQSP